MSVTLRTIPPEVARRITIHSDPGDLPSLARTSRTLQHEAEAHMYAIVDIYHGTRALHTCLHFVSYPHLAAYVRQFALMARPADNRTMHRDHHQQHHQHLQHWDTREYWEAVRAALSLFRVLDYLHIADPRMSHSWVLAPPPRQSSQQQDEGIIAASPAIRRRVRDARLFLACDEDVLRFLEDTDIQALTIVDVAEDFPLRPLALSSLPNLNTFEGPIILVMQLLHAPLTNIKVPIDSEEAVSLLPLVLPELYRLKLRAFSIMHIPEELLFDCIDLITTSSPQLKYISLIPLPSDNKSRLRLLQYLTRFSALRLIEVDTSSWVPAPVGALLRIFATEMRMAIPTLHYITFWNNTDRWHWHWNPEAARLHDASARRSMPSLVGGGKHGDGAAGAEKSHGGSMRTDGEEEDGQENDQAAATYVGLEGWTWGRSSGHWPNHSSMWKSI